MLAARMTDSLARAPGFAESAAAPVAPARSALGVWNFAFGSNLNPVKRLQRARLQPLETVPGRVRDWRLAFNMRGVRWVEPSMASIEPAPGEEVHGLLLHLTPAQWEHLDHSEGGGRAYRHQEVEVETYDGRRIRAIAFRARPERTAPEDHPPSLRYLTLIREGAAASGLDAAWCRYLDQLPHTETSSLARWLGHILVEFFTTCSRHRVAHLGRPVMATLRWADHRLPRPLQGPVTALTLLVPVGAVACFRLARRLRRLG
jgi:hypothetical protein